MQQTKPDKFLGENQLGKVLYRIRTHVEQLTAINNSAHDSIVLDIPASPSELLSTVDTSSSPPSSPVDATRVHVPPPLTRATTSLPPEVTSLSSVVLPFIDSQPTETGNDNSVLPGDTITNSLLLNSTSVSTSSSRTPAPPPRPRIRTIKTRDQKSTVNHYSRRDSSEKRKASSGSDITSPSSHHVAKTARTNHSKCYIYYGLFTLLTQAFTIRTFTTFFSPWRNSSISCAQHSLSSQYKNRSSPPHSGHQKYHTTLPSAQTKNTNKEADSSSTLSQDTTFTHINTPQTINTDSTEI